MFNSPNENPQNGFIASLQRWSRWGFWAGAILVVFAVYDLGGVAFKDPYGMHQWRQCDAYSMALNFALEERDLFHPSMHFLLRLGRQLTCPHTSLSSNQDLLQRQIEFSAWTAQLFRMVVCAARFVVFGQDPGAMFFECVAGIW